jgi:magnesium transporter
LKKGGDILFIMITTQKMGSITWVDVLSPTNEEILQLQKTYRINNEVTHDLMNPTLVPRVDECDEHLYTVLHFPANKHSHQENSQEIDFVIGENYLITVRYDTIDSIYLLFKSFEVGSILTDGDRFSHAYELFFVIIRKMYESVLDELSSMEEHFDRIEKAIFDSKEKEMVAAISQASRTLLDFKRTLIPHEEVLGALQDAGMRKFGKELSKDVSVVSKEYHRVRSRIHDDMEALVELRETNNTLLSTKQNEIIKIFTILAFITFPLSLVISIIEADRDIIWALILLVCISVGAMFTFFKLKKWL